MEITVVNIYIVYNGFFLNPVVSHGLRLKIDQIRAAENSRGSIKYSKKDTAL